MSKADEFVSWFNDRKGNVTFGDVSEQFNCSIEYVEENIFIHFQDATKVAFNWKNNGYSPKSI